MGRHCLNNAASETRVHLTIAAQPIQIQGVILNLEASLHRHPALALFDGFIEKFDNLAALNANHMVVVRFIVQFEYRTSTFEVVTNDEPRRLKLSEHTIDRRETYFFF